MSKPRYKWWGYIKNVIRDYPRLKQEYDALHEQSVTPSMSGMPCGGVTSRAVENLAIRELEKGDQRDLDAVKKAIEATRLRNNGKETLDIIEMVFWKRTYTLSGAARAVHVSYETAKIYQRCFMIKVAKNCGCPIKPEDEKYL